QAQATRVGRNHLALGPSALPTIGQLKRLDPNILDSVAAKPRHSPFCSLLVCGRACEPASISIREVTQVAHRWSGENGANKAVGCVFYVRRIGCKASNREEENSKNTRKAAQKHSSVLMYVRNNLALVPMKMGCALCNEAQGTGNRRTACQKASRRQLGVEHRDWVLPEDQL